MDGQASARSSRQRYNLGMEVCLEGATDLDWFLPDKSRGRERQSVRGFFVAGGSRHHNCSLDRGFGWGSHLMAESNLHGFFICLVLKLGRSLGKMMQQGKRQSGGARGRGDRVGVFEQRRLWSAALGFSQKHWRLGWASAFGLCCWALGHSLLVFVFYLAAVIAQISLVLGSGYRISNKSLLFRVCRIDVMDNDECLNLGGWLVVTRTQTFAGFWPSILSACVEDVGRSWDGPANKWSDPIPIIATYVGQVNSNGCPIQHSLYPLTCQSLLFGVRTSRLRPKLIARGCNLLLGTVIVL